MTDTAPQSPLRPNLYDTNKNEADDSLIFKKYKFEMDVRPTRKKSSSKFFLPCSPSAPSHHKEYPCRDQSTLSNKQKLQNRAKMGNQSQAGSKLSIDPILGSGGVDGNKNTRFTRTTHLGGTAPTAGFAKGDGLTRRKIGRSMVNLSSWKLKPVAKATIPSTQMQTEGTSGNFTPSNLGRSIKFSQELGKLGVAQEMMPPGQQFSRTNGVVGVATSIAPEKNSNLNQNSSKGSFLASSQSKPVLKQQKSCFGNLGARTRQSDAAMIPSGVADSSFGQISNKEDKVEFRRLSQTPGATELKKSQKLQNQPQNSLSKSQIIEAAVELSSKPSKSTIQPNFNLDFLAGGGGGKMNQSIHRTLPYQPSNPEPPNRLRQAASLRRISGNNFGMNSQLKQAPGKLNHQSTAQMGSRVMSRERSLGAQLRTFAGTGGANSQSLEPSLRRGRSLRDFGRPTFNQRSKNMLDALKRFKNEKNGLQGGMESRNQNLKPKRSYSKPLAWRYNKNQRVGSKPSSPSSRQNLAQSQHQGALEMNQSNVNKNWGPGISNSHKKEVGSALKKSSRLVQTFQDSRRVTRFKGYKPMNLMSTMPTSNGGTPKKGQEVTKSKNQQIPSKWKEFNQKGPEVVDSQAVPILSPRRNPRALRAGAPSLVTMETGARKLFPLKNQINLLASSHSSAGGLSNSPHQLFTPPKVVPQLHPFDDIPRALVFSPAYRSSPASNRSAHSSVRKAVNKTATTNQNIPQFANKSLRFGELPPGSPGSRFMVPRINPSQSPSRTRRFKASIIPRENIIPKPVYISYVSKSKELQRSVSAGNKSKRSSLRKSKERKGRKSNKRVRFRDEVENVERSGLGKGKAADSNRSSPNTKINLFDLSTSLNPKPESRTFSPDTFRDTSKNNDHSRPPYNNSKQDRSYPSISMENNRQQSTNEGTFNDQDSSILPNSLIDNLSLTKNDSYMRPGGNNSTMNLTLEESLFLGGDPGKSNISNNSNLYDPGSSNKPMVESLFPRGKSSNKRPDNSLNISAAELDDSTFVKVSNMTEYYSSSRPAGKIEIPDSDGNRLALDERHKKLYISGQRGTYGVDLTPDPPLLNKSRNNRRPSLCTKLVKSGNIVIQEARTNSLFLLDPRFRELKTIPGYFEKKVDKNQKFHHYIHSVDKNFMLWRAGQEKIVVVNTDTFEAVEQIDQFWSYQNSGCSPITACSNRTGTKILGCSMSARQGCILHYFERSSEDEVVSFTKPLTEILPEMHKVTCLEVSSDESKIFLAGLENLDGRPGAPILLCCTFDKELNKYSALMLDPENVGIGFPSRMKRIQGTKVLVIGCKKDFVIVERIHYSLQLLGGIINIHQGQICDFVTSRGMLYSKGVDEPYIVMTEFGVNSTNTSVSNNFKSTLSPYKRFEYHRIEHPAFVDLEKIVISEDGQDMFVGGKGLHKFSMKAGVMVPIDIDVEKKTKFFGLQLNQYDGNLIIHEPDTNDLVVLSRTLELVSKYTSAGQDIFANSKIRNPHHTSEDGTILWFCGGSTIRTVDLESMTMNNQVEDFIPCYPDTGMQGVPLRGVTKNQGNQIVVLFEIDQVLSLAVYDSELDRQPEPMLLSEVLPDFGNLYVMEPSKDKSLIFLSGKTKESLSYGIVAAIQFNAGLKMVTQRVLDEEVTKGCTTMKRFEDRDELVVGCYKHLIIIRYLRSSFEVLNIIEEIHTDLVTDVWLNSSSIYSVCDQDDYISEVIFDREQK